MDEVQSEAGTEEGTLRAQVSLSSATTSESAGTTDTATAAAAAPAGETSSLAMPPPQARRVVVGTVPSKAKAATARKKKQVTALSPRYMSDMRAFNAKRKLSNVRLNDIFFCLIQPTSTIIYC